MTEKTAGLETELAMLRYLIDSEGWKILQAKWQVLLKDCEASLCANENPHRDWTAGLVTGYRRILDWPRKRMLDIEKEFKKGAN